MAKKASGKSSGGKKAATATPTAEHRIVVLHGKEAHLRALRTEALRAALDEAFGDVETIRFSGEKATLADVLDECRSYGLMQQHKLVILDEADKLVNAETRPALERYAASPVETATLLFRSDTWRPGKLDKAIAGIGVIVKCDTLKFAEAATWTQRRAEKRHGARIDARSVEALLDRVGLDLGKLDSELAKLAAMAPDGVITTELIREAVGLTREETVWVIQSRLIGGGAEQAVRAVREALGPSKQPDALVAFAMIELARKLYGAARLLRAGAPERQVLSELRIWGEASRPILAAARSADPELLADLLRDSVEIDAKNKTGQTKPALAFEELAVRFASL